MVRQHVLVLGQMHLPLVNLRAAARHGGLYRISRQHEAGGSKQSSAGGAEYMHATIKRKKVYRAQVLHD